MSLPEDPLRKRTPLYDRHVAAGARMVPFAGYDMPVQYALGVMKEHLWTREQAGLFDVSHMGQANLVAEDGRHESAAAAIEALVPADIRDLAPGQQRYTQLLADDGGILDDLIVTRPASPDHAGRLILVVNAARKDFDLAYIAKRLPKGSRLELNAETALLALQGPAAAAVIARHLEGASDLSFMTSRQLAIDGIQCLVSRSGYTGEDGFEIAVAAADAARIWDMLSGRSAKSSRSGWVRATRSGWRLGFACTVTTSTRVHRPSKLRFLGRSTNAAGTSATSPVRSASYLNCAKVRVDGASVFCRKVVRRRVRVPKYYPETDSPSDRSRRVVFHRRCRLRLRWAMSIPDLLVPAHHCSLSCAAKRCPRVW